MFFLSLELLGACKIVNLADDPKDRSDAVVDDHFRLGLGTNKNMTWVRFRSIEEGVASNDAPCKTQENGNDVH